MTLRRQAEAVVTGERAGWRRRLAALYFGDTRASFWFRLLLISFDAATILYFVVSSIVAPLGRIVWVDCLIAVGLVADYAARMAIARDAARFPLRPASLVDALIIVSLVVPALASSLAFLRLLRLSRLMQSIYLTREIVRFFPRYPAYEEAVKASVNLVVFVLMITSVIFVWEYGRNPNINHYLDALYFTVTTLTTTGFGDITMTDRVGRLLTIVTMVVGVALFVNLARAVFRPHKVFHPCPSCGLRRHDTDAIHCKHCGRLLSIANEGYGE